MHTLKFSANISILFTEVPFLERFALAARHGFRGVEFWFPYEHSAADVAARIADSGLQCISLNASPGDTARGDWGFAIDATRRDALLASVDQAIDYAEACACNHIHVMAGVVPAHSHSGAGAVTAALAAGAEATYIEHLSLAAQRARAAGKTIVIEPLNPIDRPGYFLSTLAQARRIIDAIAADNIAIMFDVYHVQMTEGNIIARFKQHRDAIAHVQIADVPGRHEPGSGEINFPFVLNELLATGYDGWIGCEYAPRDGSVAGLHWRETIQLNAESAISSGKAPI
jgi:2-dehydrotetronate isomerase